MNARRRRRHVRLRLTLWWARELLWEVVVGLTSLVIALPVVIHGPSNALFSGLADVTSRWALWAMTTSLITSGTLALVGAALRWTPTLISAMWLSSVAYAVFAVAEFVDAKQPVELWQPAWYAIIAAACATSAAARTMTKADGDS